MGLQCHQSPCFSWGSHSTTSTCSVPAGHACVALLVFAHPGHKSIRDCTPGSEECSKCFPGTWLQECTTPAAALLHILPPDPHHPASLLHPPERRLRCRSCARAGGPFAQRHFDFPSRAALGRAVEARCPSSHSVDKWRSPELSILADGIRR